MTDKQEPETETETEAMQPTVPDPSPFTWQSFLGSANRETHRLYLLERLQEMNWPEFMYHGEQVGGLEAACKEWAASLGWPSEWSTAEATIANAYLSWRAE